MTNEDMMRPFNVPAELGGKVRDALTFNTVEIRLSTIIKDKYLLEITWASSKKQIGYAVAQCDTYEEAVRLQSVFLDALYIAKNAPVLATEEVLAGLPKDAKLMVVLDHKRRLAEHELFNEYGIWSFSQLGSENVLNYDRVHKIRANGCSKTAEYLRQFTLDGVRRVGNA